MLAIIVLWIAWCISIRSSSLTIQVLWKQCKPNSHTKGNITESLCLFMKSYVKTIPAFFKKTVQKTLSLVQQWGLKMYALLMSDSTCTLEQLRVSFLFWSELGEDRAAWTFQLWPLKSRMIFHHQFIRVLLCQISERLWRCCCVSPLPLKVVCCCCV